MWTGPPLRPYPKTGVGCEGDGPASRALHSVIPTIITPLFMLPPDWRDETNKQTGERVHQNFLLPTGGIWMKRIHLNLLGKNALLSSFIISFRGTSFRRIQGLVAQGGEKIPQPIVKSQKKDKSWNSWYCQPGCVGPNASPLGLPSGFASWNSIDGPHIESAWGWAQSLPSLGCKWGNQVFLGQATLKFIGGQRLL